MDGFAGHSPDELRGAAVADGSAENIARGASSPFDSTALRALPYGTISREWRSALRVCDRSGLASGTKWSLLSSGGRSLALPHAPDCEDCGAVRNG